MFLVSPSPSLRSQTALVHIAGDLGGLALPLSFRAPPLECFSLSTLRRKLKKKTNKICLEKNSKPPRCATKYPSMLSSLRSYLTLSITLCLRHPQMHTSQSRSKKVTRGSYKFSRTLSFRFQLDVFRNLKIQKVST